MVLYTASWALVILSLVFLKKQLCAWLLLILGISFGGLILKNSYILAPSHISNFTSYRPQIVLLKGIVDGYPQTGNRYTSFVLAAEELSLGNKVYGVTGRVLARVYRPETISYGQRIISKGKLSRPYRGSNNRASYRDYLKAQKIYAILRVSSDRPIEYLGMGKADPLKTLAYKIRGVAEGIYFKYLPPTPAGIFTAIILGDRSRLSPYLKRLFMQTGTAHILAVSGLHVGVIVFTLILFLKALGMKRRSCYIIVILCLIFYAILTGARPSVIRATVMAIILLGGFFLKREVNISYSLALAALVILIINPHQLFNLGFKLSFLSLLSIIYIYPRIKGLFLCRYYKFRFVRLIIDTFSVSLSVWLGLGVIIAYYFRIISPVTVLANMVIVPFIAIVISMGIILVLTGILLPLITPLFSATANFTLVLLISIIEFFNQLPFAYFYL
ncbi:MAG: ComEC family competence protein [Candidatus Omnitrophica bacterium]|nr:ComEC family competence protein [Candidatus Omnitrophota bacterium]MBU4473489.1 ComEC family competence protein [Candidatus Omnitrophota bacterium]MCG2706916.1 ComEC family competence protein [Candidatus Omnitrophota bacterium]